MIEIPDRPQKTAEEVRAEYRADHPLLRAYLDVIAEHSGPRVSINEPSRGGIGRDRAVALALERVGRPPRDEVDVRHAVAFLEYLLDEMNEFMPAVEKDIADYVIAAFFPLSGCVPMAGDWQETSHEDRYWEVDEVMRGIPTDDLRRLLRETLEIAMPEILRRITADDESRRRAALTLA